jgi:hypothetical protein
MWRAPMAATVSQPGKSYTLDVPLLDESIRCILIPAGPIHLGVPTQSAIGEWSRRDATVEQSDRALEGMTQSR